MRESSFNAPWTTLFSELGIRGELRAHGQFHLSTDQIKKLTRKEPRLMCKWDSRGDRPKVLQDNHVTILPLSRKDYLLIRGDGYQDLPSAGPAQYYAPDRLKRLETVPWQGELRGESAAVDTAIVASILGRFTGEKELALTVRGRSGSSTFAFEFSGEGRVHHVAVNGATVEIDAGLEGDHIWLVEVKARSVEDFIVRQLYYPWRLWKTRVKKKVIPVFLTYSNRVFGLHEYQFADENAYHSIELVRSSWFTFDRPARLPTLEELLAKTNPARSPKAVPFPQADTFESVINTIELYNAGWQTAAEVAEEFEFEKRQGDYYSNAAAWLGFLERKGTGFIPTEEGRKLAAGNRSERLRIVFGAIATRPVLRQTISRRLHGEMPGQEEVVELVRKADKRVNLTTALRRSQTVLAWVEWLWQEHARLSQEYG